MEVDSLYRLLGRPGRFHIIIYILMCCNYFPVILNHLAMAIYGARSSYQCKLPEGNPTNESIPYAITNGKRVMDRCHVYENYTRETNRTISCPDGWSYELGPRESNIISEVRVYLLECVLKHGCGPLKIFSFWAKMPIFDTNCFIRSVSITNGYQDNLNKKNYNLYPTFVTAHIADG